MGQETATPLTQPFDAGKPWGALRDAVTRAWIAEGYGQLPLSFEANQGQRKPVIYQKVEGARLEIAGRYLLKGERVGFEVGAYVTGLAFSDFPTTPGAFDTTFNGSNDAFVAKFTGNVGPLPPPSVSIDDMTVTEANSGATNAVFTVTLSNPSSQTVTVDFATATGHQKRP